MRLEIRLEKFAQSSFNDDWQFVESTTIYEWLSRWTIAVLPRHVDITFVVCDGEEQLKICWSCLTNVTLMTHWPFWMLNTNVIQMDQRSDECIERWNLSVHICIFEPSQQSGVNERFFERNFHFWFSKVLLWRSAYIQGEQRRTDEHFSYMFWLGYNWGFSVSPALKEQSRHARNGRFKTKMLNRNFYSKLVTHLNSSIRKQASTRTTTKGLAPRTNWPDAAKEHLPKGSFKQLRKR